MVRTLDSALLSSLNNVTRHPVLTLTIEDHVAHYSPYQTPGTADAWHDVCIAADNSIVRIQVTRGGTGFTSSCLVQRITDPTQAAQWSTWTALPGSAGLIYQDGGCAIANSAGTITAFAQRGTGGNNLWVWTSTNNGLTWTGPVSVLVPPAGALIRGIASAGNNDVFFLYDVSGGDALGCSFYASGSWSALRTWTLATLAFAQGVAAVWSGSTYTLIYSDGYSLATCVYDPAADVWTTGIQVAPSTNTAIGRIAPRISFADGLYTLTSIEEDAGLLTGAVYNYPRLRQSADLIHWSNGLLVPDLSSVYGAVAFKLSVPNSGSAGARYYLATLSTVFSATVFQSTNPLQYLDVSGSILSYQRLEQAGKPARLEVIIDNAQGLYNSLVTLASTYQPIGLNASLVLSEGYKTGTPPTVNDVVTVGTYHLEQIQFERSPTENRLMLFGQDLSRNLDQLSRYQCSYTNQTLAYLVTEICARASLFSVVLPSTTQMGQVIATFTLQAGQTYRHALDELCATYGLSYFLDQAEVMQFRELAASDPSIWTYQPEIEAITFGNHGLRANHIIVSGKPPVGGGVGALTTAEATDAAHLHLCALEILRHHVDPKLQTTAQCSQKATFLLAQEVRAQIVHSVTLPLNPALQLLDVITLTDSSAPVGSGQSATCRISRLLARYDAEQASAELQLTLEGI